MMGRAVTVRLPVLSYITVRPDFGVPLAAEIKDVPIELLAAAPGAEKVGFVVNTSPIKNSPEPAATPSKTPDSPEMPPEDIE